MKRAIYYFSGTGNSLCVARDLAGLLKAELLPMGAFREARAVETDAEELGLVFPVYYGSAPVIVQEFVQKITNPQAKRVFAVCTYGGAAGDSLRTVRRLLRNRGGELALAFSVPMPQNAFYKSWESKARLFAAWEKRRGKTAALIERGATGIRYQNRLLEWLMIPLTRWVIKPACVKQYTAETRMLPGTPLNMLIRMRDCAFRVSDACDGCGTCARVCPVHIALADGKPAWLHRCENCLACYNLCPRRAIHGGIVKQDYYSLHPDVGVKDFVRTP